MQVEFIIKSLHNCNRVVQDFFPLERIKQLYFYNQLKVWEWMRGGSGGTGRGRGVGREQPTSEILPPATLFPLPASPAPNHNSLPNHKIVLKSVKNQVSMIDFCNIILNLKKNGNMFILFIGFQSSCVDMNFWVQIFLIFKIGDIKLLLATDNILIFNLG